MKGKILKSIVAIVLVMTLTLVDFVAVGVSAVSYAADVIETATNNKNVMFDAYFKDENGNELSSKEASINSNDMKLYVKVKVASDGYFNGTIELGNSNFKFKNDILSNGINKIEGNTITLNQINSGEVGEYEIGIEALTDSTVDLSLLTMQSDLTINGKYKDHSEKEKNIEATRQVKWILTSPYEQNDGLELSTSVLTNKVYEINGENKRVVQVLVETGLKENAYPVKQENIEVSVPNAVEKVEVISRGTEATNGKSETEFNQNNWKYIQEEGKVEINVENNANNGKVAWNKQAKDSFVVTYIMPQDSKVENTQISVKSNLTLYDQNATTKSAENNVVVSEEIDGIVSTKVETAESSIYKGKIYSGETREYNTTAKIYVSNNEVKKAVNVTMDASKYVIANGEIDANIEYVSSVIDKTEVIKVVGEDGYLKIGDTKITKDTQADDNGKITVKYPNGTKTVKIETSNVANTGTIKIENTKAINQDNNSKEVKQEYTGIKEIVTGNNATIELKETATDATFEVNRSNLSTVVANDIEMKVVLNSANEKYDLYQNPVIKITVPEKIENLKLTNIKLLYEDELQIVSYNLENNILTIALEGTQTKYKESSLGGATIIIDAVATVNRKTPTMNTEFALAYSNENANSYANNGIVSVPVKIEAPTDVTTVTTIPELGIETLEQNEEQNVELELGAEQKAITSQIEIINNKQTAISDVKVLGILPTDSEENNAGITMAEGIQLLEGVDGEVYYTENENATESLVDSSNGWTQNISDLNKAKKYLITINELEPQESIDATYKSVIAQNLEYNQTATTSYQVIYNSENESAQNKVLATSLNLTTGTGPVAEMEEVTTVGNDELKAGDTVKAGEVIKYTLNVKNSGTEAITDGVITATVPEGTTLVEAEDDYEYAGAIYYKELDGNSYKAEIENLNPGETTKIEYTVRVNSNIQEGTEIKNSAKITYKETAQEVEGIALKATSADLRVSVKRVTDRKASLYDNDSVEYYVIVENISDKEQSNVKVKNYFSDEYKVESATIITNLGDEGNCSIEDTEYKNEINIGTLSVGETKVLCYRATLENINEQKTTTFYVEAKSKNDTYRSNVWNEVVNNFKISADLTANVQNQYVKAGDIIEYTVTVKNETNIDARSINIVDEIPEQCTIESIKAEGEDFSIPQYSNTVNETLTLGASEEKSLVITTSVNDSLARTEAEQITNQAKVTVGSSVSVDTNQVTNIIEATQLLDDANSANNSNSSSDNNIDDNNYAKGNKTISGTAWIDENRDGKKDASESTISGVTVKLLNIETNQYVTSEDGNELSAQTNASGVYMLNKVGNGKYVVVFDYDTTKYGLTQYQANGVSESENSNATISNLIIGNNEVQVATTDVIEINNQNVGNLNIGLTQLQNFDLQLDKYISKIIVQDKNGTTTTEYGDATLAKVELNSKTVNGANVVIEYKIKVTNCGEVDGYAKKIADYIPSELKFSSESNQDWYQANGVLYNTSLANEKISAGETKELTLILTKAMTENNVGLIANTAEIAEDYNELDIADSNSVPGNRASGENDTGMAEAVISLKTGATIVATVIVILTLIILTTVVLPIAKEKNQSKKVKKIIDKM